MFAMSAMKLGFCFIRKKPMAVKNPHPRRITMSKREWTDAQRQAFSAKKGNFLISAGAGSGKTSVLTERIYELVKSGEVKLQNLLVLTFTNKAAQEMKGRVRDLIKGDPATAALAPEVEAASIMTFDAFALSLVKKYHYELNLSQDIEVVDASIFKIGRASCRER